LIIRDIHVEVRLAIDATGKVLSANPVGEEGTLATTLAAEAARLWRFEPTHRGERAVPSTVIIPFKFGPRPHK